MLFGYENKFAQLKALCVCPSLSFISQVGVIVKIINNIYIIWDVLPKSHFLCHKYIILQLFYTMFGIRIFPGTKCHVTRPKQHQIRSEIFGRGCSYEIDYLPTLTTKNFKASLVHDLQIITSLEKAQ